MVASALITPPTRLPVEFHPRAAIEVSLDTITTGCFAQEQQPRQPLVINSGGTIAGTTTTNWANNSIQFKKVLFRKPVEIRTTNGTDYTDTDKIIIQATRDTIVHFEECMFTDTAAASNAYTFNFQASTNGVINTASTTNAITFYDPNGELITTKDGIIQWHGLSAKERRRAEIRHKISPTILNHRKLAPRAICTSFANVNQNEIVALQLLRSMVPHDVFKKYLKYGFVTVQGPSGLTYQIQRGKHLVKVWKMGTLLSELCVYLKDHTIPPTDEVVAKMLICECDEIDIWRRANIRWNFEKNISEELRKTTSKDINEGHIKLLAA
jgi:hypothetical protein